MATNNFHYTDEMGNYLFTVRKVTKAEGKSYQFIVHQDKDGNIQKGMGDVHDYPLYRQDLIKKNSQVIFVDLEEDAETLIEKGYAATTYPSNLKKWRREYSVYLKDKDVVILKCKQTPDIDNWHKRISLKLLQSKGLLGASRVTAVKIVELPCPDYITESVTISEWFERGYGISDEVKRLIDDAKPLTEDDLRIVHDDLVEEDIADFINDSTIESVMDTLVHISHYRSLTQRKYYLKQLAAKFGLPKKDLEADFSEHFGSLMPMQANYFRGLIDIVYEYQGDVPCYLYARDGELTTSTIYDSLYQSFSVTNTNDLDHEYAGFEVINEYYVEAQRSPREHNADRQFHIYPPSEYDRNLFQDVHDHIQQMLPLDGSYVELITYFVFLTYFHDSDEVDKMPYLHLHLRSSVELDAFPYSVLTYLVFRGVTQTYLNASHIERIANDLAATIVFKRTDIEKTITRYDLYDFFINKYRKDMSWHSLIRYKHFTERKDYLRTFSPTIMVTVSPINDPMLQKITLSLKVPKIGSTNQWKDYSGLSERLIAWRAIVLDRGFEDFEADELYKPLIQVCRWVNPEGEEHLLKTLQDLEYKPVETSPAEHIAEYLVMQFPKHGAETHDYGSVGDLAEGIAKHHHVELSARTLGQILRKDLGFQTRKDGRGIMHLIATQTEIEKLRKTYGIREQVTTHLDRQLERLNKLVGSNKT